MCWSAAVEDAIQQVQQDDWGCQMHFLPSEERLQNLYACLWRLLAIKKRLSEMSGNRNYRKNRDSPQLGRAEEAGTGIWKEDERFFKNFEGEVKKNCETSFWKGDNRMERLTSKFCGWGGENITIAVQAWFWGSERKTRRSRFWLWWWRRKHERYRLELRQGARVRGSKIR